MFQHLQQFFVEQTTAPELASFIVVVTVLFVLAAGVAYVLIMTVAWRVYLKKRFTWREVAAPDLVRVR